MLQLLSLALLVSAAPAPSSLATFDKAAAAWEKLGAERGSIGLDEQNGGLWFEPGKALRPGRIPAFRLCKVPNGKLPPVGVPFGLKLDDATDADLPKLRGLKGLSSLVLEG